MKKTLTALLGASLLAPAFASAQELTIEINNLTGGISFTPILVAAHNGNTSLFSEGEAASNNLQAMAEGGDISGLTSDAQAAGGNTVASSGMLAPGAMTSLQLMTRGDNNYLSLTAMMLPTNDGFIGMDSMMIPAEAGTYSYYLNAYDAGTEANDEIVNGGGAPGAAGIPMDPAGKNGTGASGMAAADDNRMIHIHRGNIGDSDSAGGKSDLDNTVHRWLNPVAKVTITVQ